jgi:hypothetical protein
MPYLNAKDVAVIAIISAEWGVMNYTVLPIFFTIFNGIPFMCEMVALASLILVLCLTKKFGTVTITGVVVTLVTLALSPGSTYMLGFAAASFVFDVSTRLIGYRFILGNPKISAVGLAVSSMVAAAVAGAIIGVMFMPLSLLSLLGGVGVFAGLHVLGGLVGAILGFVLLRALMARKIITPATTEQVALGKS